MSLEQAERTGAVRKNPGRFASRRKGRSRRGAVGDPPERFLVAEPASGFREAQEKLAIWHECLEMWPWAKRSDRFALEQICDLMYKLRHGWIKTGERSVLKGLQNAMGGDPSGFARIQMQGGARAPVAKPPASDPRSQYLTTGTLQ